MRRGVKLHKIPLTNGNMSVMQVWKMPVQINNETIWVECVPRDFQVKNSSTVGLIGQLKSYF